MLTTIARITVRETRHGALESFHLACGHSGSAWPGVVPQVAEGSPVGMEVDCPRCDWQTEARREVEAAHREGRLSHTRAARVGSGICAYVYASDSPTGVELLATLDDSPATHEFLRGLGSHRSPLSPTEAR